MNERSHLDAMSAGIAKGRADHVGGAGAGAWQEEPRDDQGRWTTGTGVTGSESGNWVRLSSAAGELEAKAGGGALQVREAHVREDARGRGEGRRLYEAAASYAANRKMEMTSDAAVSVSADRVWESMRRRGYPALRHPSVELGSDGKFRVVKTVQEGGRTYRERTEEPVWRMKRND